jgi:hypothetical protein
VTLRAPKPLHEERGCVLGDIIEVHFVSLRFPVIPDTRSLCREAVLVPLPGLGWGEAAEGFVFAQAAAVMERLDEGEDLGVGSGPIWPDASADFFFEQGPETLRGSVIEA